MQAEMPVVAFVCGALLLIPAPFYIRSRNIPVISLVCWLLVADLIYGINSVVWAGNDDVDALAWCDITTKLTLGATIAIPAACLCIASFLARSSAPILHSTQSSNSRRTLIDSLLCFLLPALYMIAHFAVQNHRFDLVENVGCRASIFPSAPAILLVWLPPQMLSVATLVACGFAIRNFRRRPVHLLHDPTNLASPPPPSRYLRLLALCAILAIWTLIITAVDIRAHLAASGGKLLPLSDMVYHFGEVNVIRAETVKAYFTFLWWTIPTASAFCIAALALGEEVVEEWATLLHCITSSRQRQPRTTRRTRLHEYSQSSSFSPICPESPYRKDAESQSTVPSSWSPFSSPTSTKASDLITAPPRVASRAVVPPTTVILSAPKPPVPSRPSPADSNLTSVAHFHTRQHEELMLAIDAESPSGHSIIASTHNSFLAPAPAFSDYLAPSLPSRPHFGSASHSTLSVASAYSQPGSGSGAELYRFDSRHISISSAREQEPPNFPQSVPTSFVGSPQSVKTLASTLHARPTSTEVDGAWPMPPTSIDYGLGSPANMLRFARRPSVPVSVTSGL